MPATAVSSPVLVVSDTVVKILKNFAAISDSVILCEGTTQRTVNPNETTVYAIAEFPDAWPRETGIFALKAWLGDLTLFDKPVLDFKADHMVMASKDAPRSRTYFRYSDPSTIKQLPAKMFPKDNPAVEFALSEYGLKQLKAHTSQLGLASIDIVVKDGSVQLKATNAKNSASHGYRLDILSSDVRVNDQKFTRTIPFKMEHLSLLMDGAYVVSLSDWHYGYFVNQNVPISYYVTEFGGD
jgi:hypothetical protein